MYKASVFFSILLASVLSGSFSVLIFLILLLLVGEVLIGIHSNDANLKNNLETVFLCSYSCIVLLSTLQWLGYESDFYYFVKFGADQYNFWIDSENSASMGSIIEVFKNTFYVENGGYHFYIGLLGYIANKFLDGNHLLLQFLGSSAPGVLSSVYCTLVVSKFCRSKNVVKYSLLFVVIGPITVVSIRLLRDGFMALLYFQIIYLWLCVNFSIRTLVLQLLLALIAISIREQHGLFAFVFILLTIIDSRSKMKWIYILGIIIVFIGYFTIFYEKIVYSFMDTNRYYGNLSTEQMRDAATGLGRIIYTLPSPLKEIVQIIFTEASFPPWFGIGNARNAFHIMTGIFYSVSSIVWFFFLLFNSFVFN